MPWVNGTITDTTAGEEFPEFGLETAGAAKYAKLLTAFKAFVAGAVSVVTAGANTGNGFLRGLEVSKTTTTKTWTVTFSSAVDFAITASGETTVNGTLTGTVGQRFAAVTASRFICRIYEGSTPFISGDTFTFDTTSSPLGAQTWEIISDTARGSGSTSGSNLTSLISSPNNNGDYYNLVTATLSGTTTNRGLLVNLKYANQARINQVYYITFASSTTFNVRDSVGTILGGLGTVDVPWSLGAEGAELDLTVTSGSTAFTTTTGSFGAYGGNFFTITPRTSATTGSHLTRIVVLKSTGLAGDDVIYYTLAQRVGGAFARFYLDLYVHRTHNPALPTTLQEYGPYAKRIRHASPAAGVPYYFIASGRHAYILTLPAPNDPQVMGMGLLLPHARPSGEEQVWPAFCGGTHTDTTTQAAGSATSSVFASGPFYNGQGLSAAGNSTFEVCLPGAGVVWAYGGNYTSAGIAYEAYTSNGYPVGSVTRQPGLCFILPWAINDLSNAKKIHSGVFGEKETRKALLPASVHTFGATLTGLIGEFPGLFFIGSSNDAASVNVGDTVGGGAYVIWAGTQANSAQVSTAAAFALE